MKLQNRRSISKSVVFIGLAILLWLLLIYTLSSQNGPQTAKTSYGLARYVAKQLYETPTAEQLSETHMAIRKLAHIAMFGILGVLVGMVCVKAKGISISSTRFAMGYFFLLLCSILDEWHKQFIEGRHNEVMDVLLNVIGCSIGLGIVGLIYCICSNSNNNK